MRIVATKTKCTDGRCALPRPWFISGEQTKRSPFNSIERRIQVDGSWTNFRFHCTQNFQQTSHTRCCNWMPQVRFHRTNWHITQPGINFPGATNFAGIANRRPGCMAFHHGYFRRCKARHFISRANGLLLSSFRRGQQSGCPAIVRNTDGTDHTKDFVARFFRISQPL